MDYNLPFAEAWPVELYPGRFRSDEARLKVLARIARILIDLESGDLPRTRRRLDTAEDRAQGEQHQIVHYASVPVHGLVSTIPLPEPRRPAVGGRSRNCTCISAA